MERCVKYLKNALVVPIRTPNAFVFTFCEATMWSLIILVFAMSNVASGTVTTLEFSKEQLCQMAVRELDNLTKPVVTEGAVRYKVLGACVHTSEVVKK